MHNKWWVHSPTSKSNPMMAFGEEDAKFLGSTDVWCELSFSAARLHDHEMKNIVFPLYLLAFFAAVSVMIPGKDIRLADLISRFPDQSGDHIFLNRNLYLFFASEE